MKKKVFVFCQLIYFGTLSAQFTVLHNFDSIQGSTPYGSLTPSVTRDTLFGMTFQGGKENAGCVFCIKKDGSGFKDLCDFIGTKYYISPVTGDTVRYEFTGKNPYGSLILSGNVLYGMTYSGGGSAGNLFSVHTDGTNCMDLLDLGTNLVLGQNPYGDLIMVGNVLYGMTFISGPSQGIGNIFSVHSDGTGYRDLYEFAKLGSPNYAGKPMGNLILSGYRFFGMCSIGGDSTGTGIVFSIDTNGTGFTELNRFTGTNGLYPYGSLTFSSTKDTLFGMTSSGGSNSNGCIFSLRTNGTGYKDLHDFTGVDGQYPYGNLSIHGNKLYGMTSAGGAAGFGNIFTINLNGNGYNDLFNFTGGSGGGAPQGSLSLSLSGDTLFGMTSSGGLKGDGVIFSYSSGTSSIAEYPELSKEVFSIHSLYPNPASLQIQYTLISEKSGPAFLAIIDLLGRTIEKQTLMLNAGLSTFSMDLAGMNNGIYTLEIIAPEGVQKTQKQFIVIK